MVCLLLGFTAGCAGIYMTTPPTEHELRWAEGQRNDIKRMMGRLESRIRAGDHQSIMREFVYAGTSAERERGNYRAFKLLTWAQGVQDYRILDINRSLERLHWMDLNQGRVDIEVTVTCGRGRRWKDTYHLFRPETEWLITGVALRGPDPGIPVSLDEWDRKRIIELLDPVFDTLRDEDPVEVMEFFPNTFEARYRETSAGLLRRLFAGTEPAIAVKDDLRLVSELENLQWPEPSEGFPARYAGNMFVFMSWDVTFLNDQHEGDNALKLEIYMSKQEREWELQKLRLSGEPLP